MTYATTFSGIDGWAYGLKACGWKLQWACECDPFCRAVHQKRYRVPIYPDIGSLHVSNPPKVDALIGSPPCPPFSVAGKKLGTADARHLYPAFLESVRVLEPRWVLMEQVAGILSDRRAFGEYIGGLVSLGYCVLWHCIPACSVGAPHQRDRVWIVAYAGRMVNRPLEYERIHRRDTQTNSCEGNEALGHPKGERTWSEKQSRQPRCGESPSQTLGDTARERPREARRLRSERPEEWASGNGQAVEHAKGLRCGRKPSKAPGRESKGRTQNGLGESVEALGDAFRPRLEEWKGQHARRELAPAQRDCNPLDHWRDAEAVQGQDGSVRIIKPGLPLMVNGVSSRLERSHRVARLRSTGNAVVAAIPFLIGQAINEIEGLT